MRIVIVEDEVLLAVTLRHQFEAYGISVVGTAVTGQAAVDLCRRTRPDAVLMDLRLPAMGGLEATRRIMAECPTRIVVLTAADAADARTLAEQAGAACFLTKPADMREILAALQPSAPTGAL